MLAVVLRSYSLLSEMSVCVRATALLAETIPEPMLLRGRVLLHSRIKIPLQEHTILFI